jgi:hypothetical protein
MISEINSILVGSQASITCLKYTLCVHGGITREERLSREKNPPTVIMPATELSMADSDWIPGLREIKGYNQSISYVFQNSYPLLQKNRSVLQRE